MAEEYRPVSPRFWADEKVRRWPNNAKLLALYFLTCRHNNSEGLYHLPMGYAMSDLRWKEKELEDAFLVLSNAKFVVYDTANEVILIVNALEYQSPRGPKQCTGAARRVKHVPRSPLLRVFYDRAKTLCPELATALIVEIPDLEQLTIGDTLCDTLGDTLSHTLSDTLPDTVCDTPSDSAPAKGSEASSKPENGENGYPMPYPMAYPFDSSISISNSNSIPVGTDKPSKNPPHNTQELVGFAVDFAHDSEIPLDATFKARIGKEIKNQLAAGAKVEMVAEALKILVLDGKSPDKLGYAVRDLARGGSDAADGRADGSNF